MIMEMCYTSIYSPIIYAAVGHEGNWSQFRSEAGSTLDRSQIYYKAKIDKDSRSHLQAI